MQFCLQNNFPPKFHPPKNIQKSCIKWLKEEKKLQTNYSRFVYWEKIISIKTGLGTIFGCNWNWFFRRWKIRISKCCVYRHKLYTTEDDPGFIIHLKTVYVDYSKKSTKNWAYLGKYQISTALDPFFNCIPMK